VKLFRKIRRSRDLNFSISYSFFIANLMIESKSPNSNFLEFIGKKFETNQYQCYSQFRIFKQLLLTWYLKKDFTGLSLCKSLKMDCAESRPVIHTFKKVDYLVGNTIDWDVPFTWNWNQFLLNLNHHASKVISMEAYSAFPLVNIYLASSSS